MKGVVDENETDIRGIIGAYREADEAQSELLRRSWEALAALHRDFAEAVAAGNAGPAAVGRVIGETQAQIDARVDANAEAAERGNAAMARLAEIHHVLGVLLAHEPEFAPPEATVEATQRWASASYEVARFEAEVDEKLQGLAPVMHEDDDAKAAFDGHLRKHAELVAEARAAFGDLLERMRLG